VAPGRVCPISSLPIFEADVGASRHSRSAALGWLKRMPRAFSFRLGWRGFYTGFAMDLEKALLAAPAIRRGRLRLLGEAVSATASSRDVRMGVQGRFLEVRSWGMSFVHGVVQE